MQFSASLSSQLQLKEREIQGHLLLLHDRFLTQQHHSVDFAAAAMQICADLELVADRLTAFPPWKTPSGPSSIVTEMYGSYCSPCTAFFQPNGGPLAMGGTANASPMPTSTAGATVGQLSGFSTVFSAWEGYKRPRDSPQADWIDRRMANEEAVESQNAMEEEFSQKETTTDAAARPLR